MFGVHEYVYCPNDTNELNVIPDAIAFPGQSTAEDGESTGVNVWVLIFKAVP